MIVCLPFGDRPTYRLRVRTVRGDGNCVLSSANAALRARARQLGERHVDVTRASVVDALMRCATETPADFVVAIESHVPDYATKDPMGNWQLVREDLLELADWDQDDDAWADAEPHVEFLKNYVLRSGEWLQADPVLQVGGGWRWRRGDG